MKQRTDGHRALEAWLKQRPPTYGLKDLAEAVGSTTQAVSQWFSKNAVPDPVTRIVLEKMAGIAQVLWLDAKQAKRLERCLGALAHAA